jgi:hypothetical protein
MRARRSNLRGAALAVAAVVLAAPLFAAPVSSAAETFTLPAGASTYARVHASNGHRLNFSENDRHYFAARVVGDDATTTFGLRGRPVGGDRVSANLGRRGRFDLRFVPIGRPENVPVVGFCHGAVGHWQAGYLVGHFHFRAEGGYTGVSLRKVPAARETWSRRRCHFSEALFGEHLKLRRMKLDASARAGGRHEALEAILFHRHARPAGRRVRFRAFRREREGRISIEREVKVEAPESSFASIGGPKLPEEIEVKPPAPFVGSATFTRTPESTFEWGGDLAVTFPGLGSVRLAGPKFSASVCAGKRCVTKQSKASEKLLGELFAVQARGR